MKAHGQIVIDSKDPEYNYYFVSEIEGANFKGHIKVILDSGDTIFINDINEPVVKIITEGILANKIKAKIKKIEKH